MAIQILVMTDDPATIQGVIHALEDRRARVLVHPLDSSLLVVAREASPAAILLDAGDSAIRAARVKQAIEDDGGFTSVPIFGIGGEMDGVTSSYEDVSETSSIAAEILAIAELTSGFQGEDDAGLFDSLDDEMDFASTLGPAAHEEPAASKPPAPPVPPRGAPPSLPPLPGASARRESVPGIRRDSVPGVPMPSRGQAGRSAQAAPPAAPAAPVDEASRRPRATGAMPTIEGSGRETLNLKQDLLVKDREILTLRSQVMDLEEQHLGKDEKNLHALERLAAMEAQLVDFEDQLEERQAENNRLAKSLDDTTRAQEAERAAAEEKLQEALQDREALQAALAEERGHLEEQLAEAGKRDDLQVQIIALTEENGSLSEQREGLQAQIATLTEEHGVLSEHQVGLEAQIATLTEGHGALSDQNEHLHAQNAALTEENGALSEQRDELLAITAELENAMNEADLQAAAFGARFEKADALVELLRKDLGVYVEAAHRVVEERAEQSATMGALVTQLESALEATRAAAATSAESLPATNWEAAYNAYLESSQAPSSDTSDAGDEGDLRGGLDDEEVEA